MYKLFLIVLLFSGALQAQNPLSFLTMQHVGNVSISTSHAANNTSNTITGCPSNCLLVVTTGVNSNINTDCSVSSSPALTWTKGADAGGTNTDDAEIWTAPFPAGGSITVTTSWGQNEYFSVVYAVVNNEAVLSGASGTQTLGLAPSVTVATTRANSILFCATADWNGVDGASRVYRDSPTETDYYHPNGGFTGYVYYKQCTTATSYTEGLTTPSTMIAVTVVLEIRGR